MTPTALFWTHASPVGALHHFAADEKWWILFEQAEPGTEIARL
jgi:hypothetical protein